MDYTEALHLMIHDPETYLCASLFTYDTADRPGLLSYGVRGYATPELACRITGHRLYNDLSTLQTCRGFYRRCACGAVFTFHSLEDLAQDARRALTIEAMLEVQRQARRVA